ncbi:hypothetical protein ACNJX9_17545 [Bradyrhizobium sp. DASA03076]|jgi:hypothetical protein|uniref:hypothetical protein n=1 Tax=Bradyrhizobium TaxID=374 RepID=UPI0009F81CD2|nr:hypothetical protein [Bradyrhizobium manausense]
MTVFIYVNTAKQVGDKDHIKVFATVNAAEMWFEQNDPEGVAFEYDVIEEIGPQREPVGRRGRQPRRPYSCGGCNSLRIRF